jgi:hypothetical protein
MPQIPITIRVDIPALSDLVAFLRENRQQEIDALTTRTADLVKRLSDSEKSLHSATPKET